MEPTKEFNIFKAVPSMEYSFAPTNWFSTNEAAACELTRTRKRQSWKVSERTLISAFECTHWTSFFSSRRFDDPFEEPRRLAERQRAAEMIVLQVFASLILQCKSNITSREAQQRQTFQAALAVDSRGSTSITAKPKRRTYLPHFHATWCNFWRKRKVFETFFWRLTVRVKIRSTPPAV